MVTFEIISNYFQKTGWRRVDANSTEREKNANSPPEYPQNGKSEIFSRTEKQFKDINL